MTTWLTKNAQQVLEKRYLLRTEEGEIKETPEALFKRVAMAVASAESQFGLWEHRIVELAQVYYQAMREGKFLPNSPTLMNAGRPNGQLSACFVLPIPDTLDGIFDSCKNAALIHKTGGGTGFSFSNVRPMNDRVDSMAGVASGPISFMAVFDAATEAVRQGGIRRGANMGILRVDHPDIEQFISCKRKLDKFNNFNISVGVTADFMSAVHHDREFALVHPKTKQVVRSLSATNVFNAIAENAHATGEPGLIFLDYINDLDPLYQSFNDDGTSVPGTENIEATNPCGEQPLGPGDACNLGSINVAKFVAAHGQDFSWSELEEMVELAVRFLDDVIEANHYPMPFIATTARNNRRIGIGVMGFAEALIALRIPYNSEEAIEIAQKLMRVIQKAAHRASSELADKRGNFPNWASSKWAQMNKPMRNATTTAIAPTGTISIIAGTTSGIEPLFAVTFTRRVLGGMELIDVNPQFEKIARQRNFYSEELMAKIAEEGTIAHIDGIPDDVKKLFVSAHEIDWLWHLRMQAAFQAHTDSAVSKTINLPNEATVADVKNAYLKAYDLKLKGITVYRDASRATQVLNIARTDSQKRSCAPCGEPT
jgi:ribonucleoside-diphosphate reductase alpha chain